MREWDTDAYRAAEEREYQRIRTKHPTLVTKRFECRAGWFSILEDFFDEVSQVLSEHPDREFTLLQVKEKFAGLRIYYRIEPFPFGVEDVAGGLLSAAYRAAEDRAESTCEVCGQPGSTRQWQQVWMTRCEDHADGAEPTTWDKEGDENAAG